MNTKISLEIQITSATQWTGCVWSSKLPSALQLHKGDAKPETSGAAVRITHLWRLFRSYFCISAQLFCRMCAPTPQ